MPFDEFVVLERVAGAKDPLSIIILAGGPGRVIMIIIQLVDLAGWW